MALAAWQSYSFWTWTEADLLYGETLKKYGNFFYATHEAHLTMVVISLDCMFNCGKNRQDFRELVRLMREAGIAGEPCDALIRRLDELETSHIKPIRIIRNHSFGHVLKYDQRVAMEQKHSPTQEEWMTLCHQSMVLVGKAGELLGMPVFDPGEMLGACRAEFQQIISKISDGEADQFLTS